MHSSTHYRSFLMFKHFIFKSVRFYEKFVGIAILY